MARRLQYGSDMTTTNGNDRATVEQAIRQTEAALLWHGEGWARREEAQASLDAWCSELAQIDEC